MSPLLPLLLALIGPAHASEHPPEPDGQDLAQGSSEEPSPVAPPATEEAEDAGQDFEIDLRVDEDGLSLKAHRKARCVRQGLGLVEAIPLGTKAARDWDDACLAVRLDIGGRASLGFPATGLSRQLQLARGRAEISLEGPGPMSARVAFISTRSAQPAGYLGIDGEAIVPKLQIAEARADWALTGLSAAAGLVDDPWLMPVQSRWGLRYIAPMIDDAAGLAFRSDLGGWLGWTGPKGIVSLTAALTSGEGLDLRDRNNGFNTAGLLIVRPFAFSDAERMGQLDLGVYGRDGSRGVDSARDHRVGGFVVWRHRWVSVGATTLHAFGQDADGSRIPSTLSAWVRAGDELPAIGWIRVDSHCAQRGNNASRTLTWRLGGGPLLPWRKSPDQHPPLYVAVGYEGARVGPDAGPVAGASAGQTLHTLWLQLGARFGVSVPVTPEAPGAAP